MHTSPGEAVWSKLAVLFFQSLGRAQLAVPTAALESHNAEGVISIDSYENSFPAGRFLCLWAWECMPVTVPGFINGLTGCWLYDTIFMRH